MDPGVEEVGDDAIGWVLLYETGHGDAEERGGVVELLGAFEVFGGGHEFDAVGEAGFSGGEVDDVEVEGGAGFAEDLGVGGSGDDGDVVATSGEEGGYAAERDEMARC